MLGPDGLKPIGTNPLLGLASGCFIGDPRLLGYFRNVVGSLGDLSSFNFGLLILLIFRTLPLASVTFTFSTTVWNFVKTFSEDGGTPRSFLSSYPKLLAVCRIMFYDLSGNWMKPLELLITACVSSVAVFIC